MRGIPYHNRRRAGLILLCLCCLFSAHAHAAPTNEALARLAPEGGIILTKNGKTIYARNPGKALIPASTLKIGTALAALEILGEDHRSTTELYLSPGRDLFIRGLGDPFLTSEEVERAVAALYQRGVREIRHIRIDGSACDLETPTEGAGASLNPYDAQNGCLAVNFNTVSLLVGKGGSIRSGEPQTPTLPIMAELGRSLPPGGPYRINVSTPIDRSARYAGELFAAILKQQGVQVRGEIGIGKVPEGLAPFYTHKSGRTMHEILTDLLRYSNNFIANQLFLACGVKRFGRPATWEKGKRALQEFYRDRLGLKGQDLTLVEGSGLSRGNRISPQAMIRLLEAFKPQARLLSSKNGILLKSGTLTGVSAYAGYFPGQACLDSFVVILNQPGNDRDRVLELLAQIHRGR